MIVAVAAFAAALVIGRTTASGSEDPVGPRPATKITAPSEAPSVTALRPVDRLPPLVLPEPEEPPPTPPDDGGGYTPPDDGGGYTPPDDGGGYTPPGGGGGSTSPGGGDG